MDGVISKRSADPIVVQQFFQSIEFIRKQRQIANVPRIVRYMEREYGHKPTETLQHLHKAVVDGLVIETITVGHKGTKAGVEQEGYWIPDKEQILYDNDEEAHDWYCFVCHEPGEVLLCSSCSFVYHPSCLNISNDKRTNRKWTCPTCSTIVKVQTKQQHNELGRCLNFIVSQQNEEASDLKKKLEDHNAYYFFFVYHYYDLNSLTKDCQRGIFSSVEEFQAKVKLILHNYSILFGKKHKLTKAALDFVNACLHDTKELKLCKSCFFLSSTKPIKDWFCQPCDPPHQVVWAKQKGFDFWPAKVIQVTDNLVDVRFFGKHHPRAWLPIDSVRCISVKPIELRIKRKQHWKQSSAEMKEYIRQCECVLGKEKASKIIEYDSPYGIGKNKELLKKMISGGNLTNDSISSLNFDLPTSRSKRDSHDSTDSLKALSIKKEPFENGFHFEKEPSDDISINRVCVEVCNHSGKKRPSQQIGLSSESKRRNTNVRDFGTQTADGAFADKLIQVSPNDFDGVQCSCKMRYSMILQKFKDYVIESNRFQKGKLIRAAAFKAAHEQRQVEDQTRKDVTAEFEDIISIMKLNHQRELDEVKLKHWCRLCQQEANLFCCREAFYCSQVCKDNDAETHRAVCRASEETVEDTNQRPRRIIKPKIY